MGVGDSKDSFSNWKQKIQEKRKQTPWRQFVMEIASWQQFNFYKRAEGISRYPITNRVNKLVGASDFFECNNVLSDYNKNISFFDNYKDLWDKISLPLLWQVGRGNENSEYADTIYNAKNSYLSIGTAFDVQDVLYSLECCGNVSTIISSLSVYDNSSNVFHSAGISKSFDVFYCYNIDNSSSVWFSSNLVGCNCCFLCKDLTNSSYCIENVQYSKDEYYNEIKKYTSNKEKYQSLFESIGRDTPAVIGCSEVVGAQFSSYVYNGRNICLVGGNRDGRKSHLFDVRSSGAGITDAYGCMGVSPGENFYCVMNTGFGQDVFYSYFLESCSFCLGCIGLKNKSYCIFNKQYTKEERYQKVDEIFSQMEKAPHPDPVLAAHGENALGAFFPPSMNPFYFNDTAAYLIDPSFTKEEVTAKGYLRRDEPIKVDIPAGVQTVEVSELGQYEGRRIGTQLVSSTEPNVERRINPEILKKVIIDEQGNAYRIIPMELEFLQKYGLPLPRKHWLERMKENFRIS